MKGLIFNYIYIHWYSEKTFLNIPICIFISKIAEFLKFKGCDSFWFLLIFDDVNFCQILHTLKFIDGVF